MDWSLIPQFLSARAVPSKPVDAEVCSPQHLKARQLVIGLGAMKSGTTWLSDYLASHPDFFHSPIKEMRVFSDLFRQNDSYPNYVYEPWEDYRLYRMEKIVLGFEDPRLRALKSRVNRKVFDERWAQRFDRLRALAQLSRIQTTSDYLSYFAERIGSQAHFGEISPAYSHLSPEAYGVMAAITEDVRFLFLMRDPADRAASHLRHVRRRTEKDVGLDVLLSRVDQTSDIYIRSDYGYTLNLLRSLGLEQRTKVLIYENLFSQATLDELCDWLGLARHEAVFDRRLNPGVGESLNEAQLGLLRHRLTPIYEQLRDDPATQAASSWRW